MTLGLSIYEVHPTRNPLGGDIDWIQDPQSPVDSVTRGLSSQEIFENALGMFRGQYENLRY